VGTLSVAVSKLTKGLFNVEDCRSSGLGQTATAGVSARVSH